MFHFLQNSLSERRFNIIFHLKKGNLFPFPAEYDKIKGAPARTKGGGKGGKTNDDKVGQLYF